MQFQFVGCGDAFGSGGPHGLKDWFVRVMETAFPGSSNTKKRFDLTLRGMKSGELAELGVTLYLVNHGNPGGPFFALRVEVEDRIIAYTGDTEWTDAIVKTAENADLFVAETYFRDKQVPLHLDFATLERHLPAIGAKRVILTHMSDDMLAHRQRCCLRDRRRRHDCAGLMAMPIATRAAVRADQCA